MNAIVTVLGQDRVGIIAAVCNRLANYNVNILDISVQGQGEGHIVLRLAGPGHQGHGGDGDALVDDGDAELRLDIPAGAHQLVRRGLDIRIQREDIFDAMHRI